MWGRDILGDQYEARALPLPPDGEGEVTATLVRRRAGDSRRAVLYVHGYNDYFFQTHVADFFLELGYTFYAIDLRKSGRSLKPGHTPSMISQVSDYFPELDQAARIIRAEDGHDTLVVNAHSTGGLTTSLWAHKLRGSGIINALALNSPFFDLNTGWLLRRVAPLLLASVGQRWPLHVLPSGLGSIYGDSLHTDARGRWQFDQAWKPLQGIPTRLGWVLAVADAQRRLRRGLRIDIPVLVATSTASYRQSVWDEKATRMDAVLNVKHMVRWAPKLGQDVTVAQILGGMHDLSLSADEAQQVYFTILTEWLEDHIR